MNKPLVERRVLKDRRNPLGQDRRKTPRGEPKKWYATPLSELLNNKSIGK